MFLLNCNIMIKEMIWIFDYVKFYFFEINMEKGLFNFGFIKVKMIYFYMMMDIYFYCYFFKDINDIFRIYKIIIIVNMINSMFF